ncbi:MAG: GNAT family N-acetyltransferase [Gammaproteobacteria bacterium]
MITVPSIRLAHPHDAYVIAEISRDFIEYGLGWNWTRRRVLRAIRDNATNVAVVYEQEGVLGFGIMEYGMDTAHLALLGVLPTQQKRGLGSALVMWLEAPARMAGIERMVVEARNDNSEAIAFYKKLGFKMLERIPGYYRGTVDGVRLEKKLWGCVL